MKNNIPARGPKHCCRDGEEIPGQILQVPCAKISVEDSAQDLLDTIPVEAAVQDPFVRIFVEGPVQETLCTFHSSSSSCGESLSVISLRDV